MAAVVEGTTEELLPPEVMSMILELVDELWWPCVRMVCRQWNDILHDVAAARRRQRGGTTRPHRGQWSPPWPHSCLTDVSSASAVDDDMSSAPSGPALDNPILAAPRDFIAQVAFVGSLSVLQWARAQGCRWHEKTSEYAAAGGHVDLLEWAMADHCAWGQLTCLMAAKRGRLAVLQWADDHGYAVPADKNMSRLAAGGGHLETLQWLHFVIGCPLSSDTCAAAAGGGHMHVLRWLRAVGCPWTATTCSAAAGGGHLEILQWAREEGCRWNGNTIASAARAGHMAVMQWAVDSGCLLWRLATHAAAEGGQVEALIWLRKRGCAPDMETSDRAAQAGRIEVLEWLNETGCPMSHQALATLLAASMFHNSRTSMLDLYGL